ncbi:MAG: hypothetical protein M3Q12_05255 [Pseudomonadota bacterium]|nr:hypothetical protein [Pseudomonadota bacterium]
MRHAVMKSACVVMLAACNPVKVPATAEAIASDPNRMRELMRQCKVEWAKVGDATCTLVTEAWRRRFMGNSDAQSSQSSTKTNLSTAGDGPP